MNKKKLEQLLENMPGAESSYPFGPDALVYKIAGKMFALVSQNDKQPRVTLKCHPADVEVLISQYESVIPGYYMNKKHWITVDLKGDLPDIMLSDLARGSYELVKSKLSRAEKQKLESLCI